MTPDQLHLISLESGQWIDDDGDFYLVSRYRPFLLSKQAVDNWEEYYDGADFAWKRFHRIHTSNGYAFLVDSNNRVVMSTAAGLPVTSPQFIVHFGHVMKKSSPMYSLLSSPVWNYYLPDTDSFQLKSAKKTEGVPNTGIPNPFIYTFRNYASQCNLTETQVDNLLEPIMGGSPPPAPKKINKAIGDFNGLVSDTEYKFICKSVTTGGKGFFVTRGPNRGVLLHIVQDDGRWITGISSFVTSKYADDSRCGDADNDELSFKPSKLGVRVNHRQGIFLEVVKD